MDEIQSSYDPQSLLYLESRYIEYLRVHNYKERTLHTRGHNLRLFRLFCNQLDVTQAREVTRALVLNYQSYLFHYKKANGQALSINTQRQRIGDVIYLFSWLIREGFILFNPAADIDLPRGQHRLPKAILTKEDVESILAVPDLDTPLGLRDRALIETFYSTGIRRFEMCNLNLEDVDNQSEVLIIRQGKGQKDRLAPLGERALAWIEKYIIEARPSLCPSLNERAVFLNVRGERIELSGMGAIVHRLIDSANIDKKGSCHLFRYAFASGLLENGCDIRFVQQMLGHSKIDTTAVYTQVNVRQMLEQHRLHHPSKDLPDRR